MCDSYDNLPELGPSSELFLQSSELEQDDAGLYPSFLSVFFLFFRGRRSRSRGLRSVFLEFLFFRLSLGLLDRRRSDFLLIRLDDSFGLALLLSGPRDFDLDRSELVASV